MHSKNMRALGHIVTAALAADSRQQKHKVEDLGDVGFRGSGLEDTLLGAGCMVSALGCSRAVEPGIRVSLKRALR